MVHEKDLDTYQKRCEELLDDREVEGLLFRYRHFWGDYEHVQDGHCWYRKEIRIVRNLPDIHSWESAQSFRRIPDFEGLNYRQQEGTYKLKVASVDADVFHYGWVRPPAVMQNKIKAFNLNHRGRVMQHAESMYEKGYDYGNLSKLTLYKGTHPAVMKEWMTDFHWRKQLRTRGPARGLNMIRAKHDRPKYKLMSWIEKHILFGRRLGEFKNYILLKR